MRFISKFRLRIRSLFSRDRVEQELAEEMRYHLERQSEEGIARGLTAEDARYAALQSIKDMEQRKEECRDMRGLNMIDNMVQDFRYAICGLRKSPGFALLAVVVMALGIGANTAVFSVVNGVVLKPLAYRDSDRIVTLATAWKSGAKLNLVTLPDFQDWHDQSTAFSAMAYYRSSDEPITAGSSAEYVHVARVSTEFFDALAIEAVIGRLFSAEEQKSADSGSGADRAIFAGFDSVKPMKIVGIVGDVRQWGPARKPDAEIYMPYEQHASGAGATLSLLVRTASSPEAFTNTLRRTVHELSPDAPARFTTLEASLYQETAAPRFRTLLLGIFAGLSLCLAIAGVYGVTAYEVGQRSNEIGLRMAMASMLFEVRPNDPATYAGVAVLLGAIVLAASYLPARRAAKLDPLVALRQE